MMDVCLVPSLLHLSSTKVVASLLSKRLSFIKDFLQEQFNVVNQRKLSKGIKEYEAIVSHVTKDIALLILPPPLPEKLGKFIAPLLCEIEDWLKICERSRCLRDDTLFPIINSIPPCWLTDGTIDREKSAMSLVRNGDVRPMNRFMFACMYCFYDDILDLWRRLSATDIDRLKNSSDYVVKLWIGWLESVSNKEWQFCVAWILGTSLWDENMYVLKRVLSALTPAERYRYLEKAALRREVITSDVMRLCLSLMTRAERELIFLDAILDVFRCITAWPLRSSFVETVNNLWPYITRDTFKSVIEIILCQIAEFRYDYFQLVEILRIFWTNRPCHFREFPKSRELRYVLKCDSKKSFSKEKFLQCFQDGPDYLSLWRMNALMAETRRRQGFPESIPVIFPS